MAPSLYPSVSPSLVHGGIPFPIFELLCRCLSEEDRVEAFKFMAAASADLRFTAAQKLPDLSSSRLAACFPILSSLDDPLPETTSWSDFAREGRLILDEPSDPKDGCYVSHSDWSSSDFYPWDQFLASPDSDGSLEPPLLHPVEEHAARDWDVTHVIPRTYVEHMRIMNLVERSDNMLIDKKAARERHAIGGARIPSQSRLSGERFEPLDRTMYEFTVLDGFLRRLESPGQGYILRRNAPVQSLSPKDYACQYFPRFVHDRVAYSRCFVLCRVQGTI